MTRSKTADLEFSLTWNSPAASHNDRLFKDQVNFWRDIFPGNTGDRIGRLKPGGTYSRTFKAGELVPPYDHRRVYRVPISAAGKGPGLDPREIKRGRFYPAGEFASHTRGFRENIFPCRITGKERDFLLVDLNHPLSKYELTLTARIARLLPERTERGGTCNHMGELITDLGPGMQAPLPDADTDFFSGSPFVREDETEDLRFYEKARFTDHLDRTALEQVSHLYDRLLSPGTRILDLMASWHSHLPKHLENISVTGLGLNREELEKNEILADFIIHDLNTPQELPFPSGTFDAVICSLSVEYITRPIELFRDVARILKPGGIFINTFSDRWFPPKAIGIWKKLHPFERMGLVIEYYRKTGAFKEICTESIRGLPRPEDDKYASERLYSDPIFAIWGACL